MVDRYGTHYTSLPANKRGQGSEFMKRFEDVRNDFSGTNHNSFNLQLVMRNLNESDPNCIQYDPEDGEITLTSSVSCCQTKASRLMQRLVRICRPVSIRS